MSETNAATISEGRFLPGVFWPSTKEPPNPFRIRLSLAARSIEGPIDGPASYAGKAAVADALASLQNDGT
jgi:hypothetical protein